jgi:hypothetical protein
MNERKYDRLANVLVFIATGSALLFDAGKFSQIAVGVIGEMAGVGAVTLYFLNQRRGPAAKHEESATKELSAKADARLLAEHFAANMREPRRKDVLVWESILGDQIERYAIQAYHRETAGRYFSRNTLVHGVRRSGARHWYLMEAQALQQQEVVLSPNDVAACAVEIIRHLSSGEDHDRWEFSFGPNGLRVSSKKGQPDRPMILQEDFGFAQTTSTMVQ